MADEQGQQEAAVAEPEVGPVANLFREALPGVEMTAEQTAIDVAISVGREDLLKVMETAKDDERLGFDFLRSLSGVDHLDGLEVVYHLYSYKLGHSVAIKARCPTDDAHMPTVSHLWQTANWHEREAAEMFGFVFEGHPDPRPLLTEEGLGYYILRKTHPLAEIEEWQEDDLKAAEAEMVRAAESGEPMDERAMKIVMAQKKAEVIKSAREEARKQGLDRPAEKEFVQKALKEFEASMGGGEAKAEEAPAKPADDRAAKIQLAQKKAEVIKKTREEARAKGLSQEEERKVVAEALKEFSEQQEGGAASAAEAKPAAEKKPPAEKKPMDRAAKIALAQKKAELIKKTRDEAREKGLSQEEERKVVAEALKAFSEEQGE